jgi:ribosomal protein L29
MEDIKLELEELRSKWDRELEQHLKWLREFQLELRVGMVEPKSEEWRQAL